MTTVELHTRYSPQSVCKANINGLLQEIIVTYIGHYISTLYITYIRHYISALFNLSFTFIHCHKR